MRIFKVFFTRYSNDNRFCSIMLVFCVLQKLIFAVELFANIFLLPNIVDVFGIMTKFLDFFMLSSNFLKTFRFSMSRISTAATVITTTLLVVLQSCT